MAAVHRALLIAYLATLPCGARYSRAVACDGGPATAAPSSRAKRGSRAEGGICAAAGGAFAVGHARDDRRIAARLVDEAPRCPSSAKSAAFNLSIVSRSRGCDKTQAEESSVTYWN